MSLSVCLSSIIIIETIFISRPALVRVHFRVVHIRTLSPLLSGRRVGWQVGMQKYDYHSRHLFYCFSYKLQQPESFLIISRLLRGRRVKVPPVSLLSWLAGCWAVLAGLAW